MSATSPAARLAPLVFAAVSAAAMGIAGCGTSSNDNTAKPTTSRPTTSVPAPAPPPGEGIENIEGMVSSVSGNTIHLRLRNGAATVEFSPSTTVTEVSSAQLSDVTVGSCVHVDPTPESARSGAAVTAQSVTISPAVGGKCPPSTQPGAGGPAPSSAAAEPSGVQGTVASVSGNTVTVTNAGGKTPQTTVTVTDTTTYAKQSPSTTQAITQGKCMAAQGPDQGGVLHATAIELEACPPMGRPHHRFPHLPHHRR